MFAYEASDCNGPDLDVTRDDPDFSDDREVFVKAPVHCYVNLNGCYLCNYCQHAHVCVICSFLFLCHLAINVVLLTDDVCMPWSCVAF